MFSIYLGLRNRSSLAIKSKKGIAISVLIAVISSVMADILVLYGLRVGSSITWSLLVCSAPLVTYLLAIPFLREEFKIAKLGAVITSIIGALVIIYIPGMGIDLVHGAPYFITAVILFGITNILTQFVFRYVTPIQLTLIKMVSASLLTLPLLPLLHIPITQVNWLLIILNSLVLLFANILVNYVIHEASATFFSVGTNMAPLFVTLMSILMINVWPTYTQILGGVVIVGSILIFQYSNTRPKELLPNINKP